MRRLSLCLLLLIFICFSAYSQKPEKIRLLDVFRSALFDNVLDSTLTFENKIIYISETRSDVSFTDARSLLDQLRSSGQDIPLDQEGRIRFRNSLFFSNCTFPDGFRADSLNMAALHFEDCILDNFLISQSFIVDLFINSNEVSKVMIRKTRFYSLDFAANKPGPVDQNGIELVMFSSESLGSFDLQSLGAGMEVYFEKSRFSCEKDPHELNVGILDESPAAVSHTLSIADCIFEKSITRLFLNNRYSSLTIAGSAFDCPLDLNSSLVSETMELSGNRFSGPVFLNGLTLQGELNCKWEQLDGRKLGVVEITKSKKFGPGGVTYWRKDYLPSAPEDFGNVKGYDELVSVYQMLLGSYRLRGDLESGNACFAEMKDLQTDRLAWLYHQRPSFTTYFRWKLSQLMKFYTNHGTDPARAIVISIEVVLLFALIYFFFPSDWDVTSKSQLLQHVKTIMGRKQKGLTGTFFRLLWGLVISLVNAFTLSLNAFTTLGFGNIPTYGLARYFCVLEGFIGWFLLSIFTVALINQVLG